MEGDTKKLPAVIEPPLRAKKAPDFASLQAREQARIRKFREENARPTTQPKPFSFANREKPPRLSLAGKQPPPKPNRSLGRGQENIPPNSAAGNAHTEPGATMVPAKIAVAAPPPHVHVQTPELEANHASALPEAVFEMANKPPPTQISTTPYPASTANNDNFCRPATPTTPTENTGEDGHPQPPIISANSNDSPSHTPNTVRSEPSSAGSIKNMAAELDEMLKEISNITNPPVRQPTTTIVPDNVFPAAQPLVVDISSSGDVFSAQHLQIRKTAAEILPAPVLPTFHSSRWPADNTSSQIGETTKDPLPLLPVNDRPNQTTTRIALFPTAENTTPPSTRTPLSIRSLSLNFTLDPTSAHAPGSATPRRAPMRLINTPTRGVEPPTTTHNEISNAAATCTTPVAAPVVQPSLVTPKFGRVALPSIQSQLPVSDFTPRCTSVNPLMVSSTRGSISGQGVHAVVDMDMLSRLLQQTVESTVEETLRKLKTTHLTDIQSDLPNPAISTNQTRCNNAPKAERMGEIWPEGTRSVSECGESSTPGARRLQQPAQFSTSKASNVAATHKQPPSEFVFRKPEPKSKADGKDADIDLPTPQIPANHPAPTTFSTIPAPAPRYGSKGGLGKLRAYHSSVTSVREEEEGEGNLRPEVPGKGDPIGSDGVRALVPPTLDCKPPVEKASVDAFGLQTLTRPPSAYANAQTTTSTKPQTHLPNPLFSAPRRAQTPPEPTHPDPYNHPTHCCQIPAPRRTTLTNTDRKFTSGRLSLLPTQPLRRSANPPIAGTPSDGIDNGRFTVASSQFDRRLSLAPRVNSTTAANPQDLEWEALNRQPPPAMSGSGRLSLAPQRFSLVHTRTLNPTTNTTKISTGVSFGPPSSDPNAVVTESCTGHYSQQGLDWDALNRKDECKNPNQPPPRLSLAPKRMSMAPVRPQPEISVAKGATDAILKTTQQGLDWDELNANLQEPPSLPSGRLSMAPQRLSLAPARMQTTETHIRPIGNVSNIRKLTPDQPPDTENSTSVGRFLPLQSSRQPEVRHRVDQNLGGYYGAPGGGQSGGPIRSLQENSRRLSLAPRAVPYSLADRRMSMAPSTHSSDLVATHQRPPSNLRFGPVDAAISHPNFGPNEL